MHPVIEILALHLGLSALWIPPARRLLPEVHPAALASLGYILGATALIFSHHVLNFVGIHSDPAAWLGCALCWAVIMRKSSLTPRSVTAMEIRDCLGIAALTAAGLGLRLVDPLQHHSLATGDSYTFLKLIYQFVEQGILFHDYICGIPVLLGSLSFRATPFELLHYGLAVPASMGIPAFFALGCAVGGRKTGWLSAIGLAGCFGILHVASMNLVFVQFSTLSLVLPWLLILVSSSLRKWSLRQSLLLACVLLFLVFTGTYFALLLSVAIGIWIFGLWALRALPAMMMMRGLLILSIVPAWIVLHYAVVLPIKHGASGANFTAQVGEFEKLDKTRPKGPGVRKSSDAPETRSPALRGLLLFAEPKRFEPFRSSLAESVLLWTLVALGGSFLRLSTSVSGLVGFLIVFSMLGTIAGVMEMPAYQGRYLYMMALLGLPLAAGRWVLNIAPYCLRHAACRRSPVRVLFRSKTAIVFALIACIPSFFFPPVTGRTIPIDPTVLVRCVPEDDLLTRLAFSRYGGSRLQMVFLFRSTGESYRGSSVWFMNRKCPVADADIRIVFTDKLPPKMPYAEPNQPIALIMPRELWDKAAPEVKAGLLHQQPARILHMTPSIVVVDVGPVPAAPRVQHQPGEP